MSAIARPPTGAALTATLGAADGLWSDLIHAVEDAVAPLDTEWRPSKTEFGRMCLLRHKKRTLLYLTPEKEQIRVAIVLGEHACRVAMASALPAAIKKLLSEARPYAEGRGIRFSVRDPGDIPTVRALVEIKTTLKPRAC